MISLKREVPVKAAGEERDVWSHGQLAYLTHSEWHWALIAGLRPQARGQGEYVAPLLRNDLTTFPSV